MSKVNLIKMDLPIQTNLSFDELQRLIEETKERLKLPSVPIEMPYNKDYCFVNLQNKVGNMTDISNKKDEKTSQDLIIGSCEVYDLNYYGYKLQKMVDEGALLKLIPIGIGKDGHLTRLIKFFIVFESFYYDSKEFCV